MFNADQVLTVGAFLKWMLGEPMSLDDFNRILHVIDTKPLQVDTTDQQTALNAQVRFKSLLQSRFLTPPKGGG